MLNGSQFTKKYNFSDDHYFAKIGAFLYLPQATNNAKAASVKLMPMAVNSPFEA